MARDGSEPRSNDAAEDADREGLGDDQGTRIGRPTPTGDPGEYPGVHARKTTESKQKKSTGAGSEAAEGLHAAGRPDREPEDRSSLRGASDEGKKTPAPENAGSEPLAERDRVAKHSYGGEGGRPRRPPDEPE